MRRNKNLSLAVLGLWLSITPPQTTFASSLPIQARILKAPAQTEVVQKKQTISVSTENLSTLRVQSGDLVQTGEQGGATLLLTQGKIKAAVKLSAHSKLKLLPPGSEPNSAQIEVSLLEGSLSVLVSNPEHQGRAFRLSTRSASVGVRGTGFFMKAKDGQPSFLCACHGEIEIKSRGDRLVLNSKHHDYSFKFSKIQGTLTGRLERAPMGEDHTDADGDELREAINRE